MNTAALDRLRGQILQSDNLACFIERENILSGHSAETCSLPEGDRYLHEFKLVLAGISTPVEADDVFAGRMVEARWTGDGKWAKRLPFPWRDGLASSGHITLPTADLLGIGLEGILKKVHFHADRIDTPQARYFERQAEGCITAIRNFCARYADAAETAGKPEMAKALRVVPFKPAYDLYSALQSIWMFQFICSTVCGARDFAPGRLDLLLKPYCTGDREKTVELLAFFLMKFNEITGTATDNYAVKPVPCQASKQYIVLGPEFNEVSEMLIEAAEIVRMPQPTFNFRLKDDLTLAARAAHSLDAQCNFFNDRLIYNKLLNSGIRPEDAENYTFTACNRVDLPGKLYNIFARIDRFDNSTMWFRQAVLEAEDVDQVPDRLFEIACREMKEYALKDGMNFYTKDPIFRLESLFIDSCVQSCRDMWQGGAEIYRWQHRMFSGIANMADSMTSLHILRERFSYKEIVAILEADFDGHEELRQEILNTFPKYGNGDPAADIWARRIGNILIDAFEKYALELGIIPMPSFYSLTRHAEFGRQIGATPDGRKAGTPISENQSPVHGMDKEGPTALLASVSALPLKRCICGGLNLKFGVRPNAEVFESLIRTFFLMDGLHVGFTVADRRTLEDARKHPEEYQTLLIRKTGFSEFFVSLSPEEQQEVIDRTEY